MTASGAYMALLKSQPGNIRGGTLTLYLGLTASVAARRKDGAKGIFDWGTFLIVVAVGAFNMTYGLEAAMSQTGLKYGYPPGPYLFLGSVALLAAAGDVRRLVRGGIVGAQRIARHLWRMCFGLFIAASSVFLARQQLLPVLLRKAGVLFFLSFRPLILMIFWLVRVLFTPCVIHVNVPGWQERASAAPHMKAVVFSRYGAAGPLSA
jgi:hypothetical protein